MLDRKFIVENADLVKQNCVNRGVEVDVDRFVQLEQRRKACKSRSRNSIARRTRCRSRSARPKTRPNARPARNRAGSFANKTQTAGEIEQWPPNRTRIQRQIPNLSHPAAPIGVDDKSNLKLFRGKTPVPKFDFTAAGPRRNWPRSSIWSISRPGPAWPATASTSSRTRPCCWNWPCSGTRSSCSMGEGFTPIITPDLARNDVLAGIGFIPRGPETQIYSIENTDLSLVATAEITLGGMLAGQTLEAESLPMKFCGISHCFRTEAGAHGRATRGLYRVHQFTKIEMFAFTLPERKRRHARTAPRPGMPAVRRAGHSVSRGRHGHGRSRRAGLSQVRSRSLDARGGGEFGEVTSTSNCTDYQARRLNIRYRAKGEKGTHFVHTLNGTAIAISRALIAILENYQQADGSIIVPEVLRPFVGKERIG